MNNKKGQIDQLVPEPYYPKKPHDPFAAFVDNNGYKEALKNNLKNKKKQYHEYQQPQQPQQQQQSQANSKKGSGNLPISHDPIKASCSLCGKPIQESWTEDSKKRIFHNECFVCCQCGTALGSLGKYVTVGKGVMCRPCRNKQMQASR